MNASSIVAATNDPFCAAETNSVSTVGPGTRKMVTRLQELLKSADPIVTMYLNERRVQELSAARAATTSTQQWVSLTVNYAQELLRSGKSAEAIREYEGLSAMMRKNGFRFGAREENQLELERGVAFLRLGEQDNCISNHTSDSCLMPIEGAGVHKFQRGSRGAIDVFTGLSRRTPSSLGTPWLLNIAYMTVGEYPGKVPTEYLIPPKVFASEFDLPRFPDAAAAAGLDVEGLAGGCITDDFDGDGLLDVVISGWDFAGQMRFFHNNGDGTFSDRTCAAGLCGITASLNIMQTDYNNDGHPDIFMLRGAWLGKGGHHPNSLLRNNGDGTFEDVTEQAGLLSFHPTQTATWFDFDGDGWLDLFIGNESAKDENHPCELYRNNGNGTFTECAASVGVGIVGFVKGVTSGDYDNDGRPDLYVSRRGEPNVLLHNEGPAPGHSPQHFAWRFSDVTSKGGVAEPLFSFPTWFFDYDNDGYLDIFVAGYRATISDIAADYLNRPHTGERARIYHNNRDGTFKDVTKSAGLYKVLHAMGCNFGDFDNDGWLDFYIGTGDPDLSTLIPNRAFRNNRGTNFQDVTTAGGFGHLQKGHAIAFADLDNDGDQDVYAVMGGAYSGDTYRNALFVNPGNSNHWITLKLEGTRSNRAAIGARIHVIIETAAGPRSIYKTVCSGGSFGASPLRQEIGLGDAKGIKAIHVFWPATGKTQTFDELAMDRSYRIREGSDNAAAWQLPVFKLATHKSIQHQPHVHSTAKP